MLYNALFRDYVGFIVIVSIRLPIICIHPKYIQIFHQEATLGILVSSLLPRTLTLPQGGSTFPRNQPTNKCLKKV